MPVDILAQNDLLNTLGDVLERRGTKNAPHEVLGDARGLDVEHDRGERRAALVQFGRPEAQLMIRDVVREGSEVACDYSFPCVALSWKLH